MNKYYLAYGSNINVQQMQWRCPTAKVVGTAYINNYQLLFRGSKTGAYLTIEPAPGHTVPVVVWRIDQDCEHALDMYEGFPQFYIKREFVITKNDQPLPAFAYVMRSDRPLGIPRREYVETCLAGYRQFKFNAKYLQEAFTISKGREQQWTE